MSRPRQRAAMHDLGSASHHHFLRDWERLRHRPSAIRRAAGWRLVTGPLHDLDQIVELTRPGRPEEEREATLHRLVGLARDDDLAARVLLQRLLPDLVHIHRRRNWQPWARRLDVGIGDLMATGWIVIRTYNPDRRPARLVSSLVSDIEYREYRAPLRRVGHGDPSDPVGFDALADVRSTDATVELAALVGAPGAGLDESDHDLIRRLVSGRMTIDIARDLGVTARTIRNRRDRIVVRLREVALAA